MHKYLEYIVDSMPGVFYWKDRGGVYLGCNNFKIPGLEHPSKIIGKTDYELYRKEEADLIREHDVYVMTSGNTLHAEEKVTLPNGEIMEFIVDKMPLRNKSEKIIGLIGTSLDITELKRTRQKLAESEKRESHFKAMSALGGMMAHELRTPLTSIELNAQIIKEYFPILVEAYREHSKHSDIKKIRKEYLEDLDIIADDIEQSARYASNTISTILSGFHYSTSKVVPLEEIDLTDVIQQALADYPLSKEERALITVQSVDDCKVMASPNMLIHVLHNLLKNALYAIQAANKGMIIISVKKTKEGFIQIIFKDNAKGIPDEVRNHIFEPFYTTKDGETSIGLGLYFSKIVLEKMNASITCESKEGKYTIFVIQFKELNS